MPSRIVLASGAEFVIAEPYAIATHEMLHGGSGTFEATMLHWRNPDSPDFDEDAPAPVYSESLATIVCSSVTLVEREESWVAEVIDKCRRHQAEQA